MLTRRGTGLLLAAGAPLGAFCRFIHREHSEALLSQRHGSDNILFQVLHNHLLHNHLLHNHLLRLGRTCKSANQQIKPMNEFWFEKGVDRQRKAAIRSVSETRAQRSSL